jgi:hypothetical protein
MKDLDSNRTNELFSNDELLAPLKEKDLKEEKEDTTTLMETINQLQSDMVELAFKLCVQDDLNITKDNQIAALKKQIDHHNESTQREPRSFSWTSISDF